MNYWHFTSHSYLIASTRSARIHTRAHSPAPKDLYSIDIVTLSKTREELLSVRQLFLTLKGLLHDVIRYTYTHFVHLWSPLFEQKRHQVIPHQYVMMVVSMRLNGFGAKVRCTRHDDNETRESQISLDWIDVVEIRRPEPVIYANSISRFDGHEGRVLVKHGTTMPKAIEVRVRQLLELDEKESSNGFLGVGIFLLSNHDIHTRIENLSSSFVAQLF